jgi:hypothetical protein
MPAWARVYECSLNLDTPEHKTRCPNGIRVLPEGGLPTNAWLAGNLHPLTHDSTTAIRSGSPAAWADSDRERGISTKSALESR